MKSQIVIPASIEEAVVSLNGLGQLLTAKQWERAAIVYAFTEPHKNQNPVAGNTASGKMSFTEFASKGIIGLADRDSVADYHKAWQSAIDQGKAVAVKPGDTITEPDLTWPPTGHTTGSTTEKSARAYIARNPQVVVEAVKAVPAVAAAVTTAIAHDTDLTSEVERKAFAKRIGAKDNGAHTPTTIIPTYEREKELAKAIAIVSEAIKDEHAGSWTPGPGEAAQLTILYLQLKDRADRYAAAQPEVHGEIDDFLKQSSRGKE